jgi:glycosyltransferase 2 family protein
VKKSVSRTVRFTVTALILAGLVLFARTVNWHETWAAMRSADLRVLALAAVVNLLSLGFKAVRWWIFLRAVGAPSFPMALKATYAGAGLNNILVANGGEAARVIFVARAAHVQSARVLATLALDRMFELIGYVAMLALAVSFLALPHSLERMRPIAWAALIGVTGLMVYLVRRPRRADVILKPTSGWRAGVKAYAQHFLHTLGDISTGPRFLAALGLSVGGWALQVATYALTARAAHFDISLVGTVAAILAVNLGFALRATPGNVGVFQMMYAVIAAAFGQDTDQAIAVGFLIQVQQILPVTLLGIALAPEFIFRRKTAHRADDPIDSLPFASRASEVPDASV